MTFWTADKTLEAYRLYITEGYSASVTARKIGAISRSAVIGKGYRMGWERASDINMRNRVNAGKAAPHPPRELKRKVPRELKPMPLKIVKVVKMTAKPPSEPTPDGVALMDLTIDSCRFPLGHTADAETPYCGKQKERGSYCAHHAAKAYTGLSAPSVKRSFAGRMAA